MKYNKTNVTFANCLKEMRQEHTTANNLKVSIHFFNQKHGVSFQAEH